MSTMSVDEIAATTPCSPAFAGGGRSIVFAETVDIPDPPYVRWKTRRARVENAADAATTTDHALSRKESFSVIGNQRV